MKISKFLKFAPAIIKQKVVLLVEGFPGIGKSQIADHLGTVLGFDTLEAPLIPAIMMPSDLTGLPFRKSDDLADFLPYGFAHQILNAKKDLLVVIDDLIQGAPLMQAGLMQAVEARIITGKKIPDCVHFIMLTNGAGHGAGGSRILEPLKGRSCIVHLEVDAPQWIKWGVSTGRIQKEILFYIQTYPKSLLCDFKVSSDIVNTPSPRNWERVSKLMEGGIRDHEWFAGCIGEKEATTFNAFLQTIDSLKGVIPQILKDPDNAPLYDQASDIDKVYSIGLALGHNATDKNFPNIYRYLNRVGGEAKEFILAQVLQFHPELKQTSTYIDHIQTRK